MYSIVLLAAVCAGENTADLGWKKHGGYTTGVCYGSCYGACYDGYAGYLWNGGWGLPYGGYGPGGPGYGPPGYTCFGCCGCYASPAFGYPAPVVGGPAEPTAPADKAYGDEQVNASNQARVIVELPTGAKLFVDDKPIQDGSPRQSFRTPVLQKGEDYYYEIRAEVVRDGKPVSETRRVVVKAGAVIRTDFRALGQPSGVASAKER
jgi:uncharacterized protein (TIGR03000 family)